MVTETFMLFKFEGTTTGSRLGLGFSTTNSLTEVGWVTVQESNGYRDDYLDDNPGDTGLTDDRADQVVIADSLPGPTPVWMRAFNTLLVEDATTGETFELHQVLVSFSDGTSGTFLIVPEGTASYFFSDRPKRVIQVDGNGSIPYNNIVCIARGALIKTIDGEKLIEDLQVGDKVLTSDNGFQPVRWIGSKRLGLSDLADNPKLRPVRIDAGALGDGLPQRDLMVSRQHRILLRSEISERMFGNFEVLIPAIKLVELNGIAIADDVEEVEYFHLLLDRHELIDSNGTWTESLFTGPEALKAVGAEARKEIAALFPKICDAGFKPEPVRHIPESGKQIKPFVSQLAKRNKRPISAAV